MKRLRVPDLASGCSLEIPDYKESSISDFSTRAKDFFVFSTVPFQLQVAWGEEADGQINPGLSQSPTRTYMLLFVLQLCPTETPGPTIMSLSS